MKSTQQVIDRAHEWLTEALGSIDDAVLLSSPYVTDEVCQRIATAAEHSPHPFVLVTALDPSAVANGYLSVQGLSRLLKSGVELRHVPRIHAKCFIVGRRAMLGSANLTGAGLGSSAHPNRELGVELTGEQTVAARATISSWSTKTVTPVDLDELLAKSRALTATPGAGYDALDADSALPLAEGLLIDARDPHRGLWLKLEYGEPALAGWLNPSWFASPKKGRPGFRPGDLVIICAKDTGDCYAVVEVTDEAEFQPQDYLEWVALHEEPDAGHRWPWVNRTKPRLVPATLMEQKLKDLGIRGQALQNGHVRLTFDQFTVGVRTLARLAAP